MPKDAPVSGEYLGTKEKFWYDDPSRGKCLFKLRRPETGEDWSEKIAEQIAIALHIPCATYELATHDGNRGIVSPRMHGEQESLVMGNEILAKTVLEYEESTRGGGNRHHTVDNVLDCLRSKSAPAGYSVPAGLQDASDIFVGYLMLDALIGNTDRHHENWACITTNRGEDISLAPTFDHASSLGRELQEKKRVVMLSTKDANQTAEAYASRALSLLHKTASDPKRLTTIEAFNLAKRVKPAAADIWLNILSVLDTDQIRLFFEQVPEGFLSAFATDVGVRIVLYNKQRLLNA